ncbi:hypothetical protein [Mucilaginibacter pedocola]|uniref:DUF1440 domain-containing protein n=1 Tax=Mucilaginibacter pedocola TaxID=1792845 RepID=A0A1S9PL90_9SPHI|nr:hypothetical protein [Mucilaginibacter pedocola]OOQ61736.1 hypothetical protein BC343_01305 [Mucilaginibacter pedocola]
MQKNTTAGLWLTGIVATLIAGTLDALAAIYIFAGGHIDAVFRYIAAGLVGRDVASINGGRATLVGIFLHYLITAFFTVVFFVFYGREQVLRKNALPVSFIYGILIWTVMNLLVLPVSKLKIDINQFRLGGALAGIATLIVCVALPIVLARRWYETRTAA